MFTLEELYRRWDAAKAAGEDHVKVSKYEFRHICSWDINCSGYSRVHEDAMKLKGRPTENGMEHVYQEIPIKVVDVL